MSGILDSKSRVMDTIITLEGRRQIASADLKIEYVSFTDAATFYKSDLTSGSADATSRIYFEQCHLPQDQIVFEADDSGKLMPFMNELGINVKDGQVLSYSFNALTASVLTGSNQNMHLLKGEEFASAAESLLASSINNFNHLRLIGTKDRVFEDDGFNISNRTIEFNIHNDKPISDATTHAAHINHLESLFQDPRLSNVRNFKFLPPINKIENDTLDKRNHKNTKQYHLGDYRPWGQSNLQGLTFRQLEHELEHYDRIGYSKTVNFDPTSMKNNIIGQFFEINFNVMKKLDVIDFGWYVRHGVKKHAFFVGKVMNDENDTNTFIHLFTLVFGN